MAMSPIIEKAFAERPDLKKRTYQAIAQSPQHATLFHDIAAYTQTLLSPSTQNPTPTNPDPPPPSKKRKLDSPAAATSSTNGTTSHPPPPPPPPPPPTEWKPDHHSLPSTSFLVPQRKKLTLEISAHRDEGLRARNPITGAVEFGVAWRDVRHVVCVPVPEKAQRQFAFCVIPAGGDGVSAGAEEEAMVWVVVDAVGKKRDGDADGEGKGKGKDAGYKGYVRGLLDVGLGLVGKGVVEPEEREFASALVQAHRKGERAWHVGAWRGSKDGFLFFLRTGILYAFKKPLLFFPLDAIDAVSYTSVLQRTFNLNITVTPSAPSSEQQDPAAAQDFEFSMLDQADFAGIDAYVKRHGLQDASMAEERRAKRLNVNGVRGEGREGEGELEKAGREVGAGDGGEKEEEEEDEGEEGEDYDPGSEGESEGSGTSSEEEEGGDGKGEGGEEGLLADEDEFGSGGEEEGEEEL